MKDLKIVLLIGVPLLVVMVGLFYANRSLSPEDGPAIVSYGGGGSVSTGGTDQPIPYRDWPREPGVRGNSTLIEPGRRPPPKDGVVLVLSLAGLRKLLAKGDQESWEEIERLLKYGNVEDPVEVAGLLVQALGEVHNGPVWVVKLLAFLKDEGARASATEKLLALAAESEDANTLKGVFGALGQIGTGKSVATLADLARSIESAETARAAIAAIGMIGSSESATALVRLLVDRRGGPLEGEIVDAMRAVGSPEMVAELRPLLSADQPAELRQSAIRAMGLTRSYAAVGSLLEVIGSEAGRELKEAGIVALGRVGAAEELLRIRKENPDLANAAGLALGSVERRESLGAILRELDGETDPRVKDRMIKAVGNIGSLEGAPKLRAILDSVEETQSVRGRSARSLAKLGDVDAIPKMAIILENAREDEQNLKIEVIFAAKEMIRFPKARQALIDQMLPVLRRITAERRETPEYYYALEARRFIESLTLKKPR